MVNEQVAKDLLHIKAVQINPDDYYTWTSGLKSPIYCDNRLTMAYPEVRRHIAEAFKEMTLKLDVKPDVIAGCATAGIPHAAWLAEELGLPMAYVRSKPKGHGKGNQIEGIINKGQNVLVIEDLISTGGSSIEAADAIKAAGATVVSVFSIFTYGLTKAANSFREAGYNMETITDYDTLLDILVDEKQMTESEHIALKQWREGLN